jgi:cephalosporin hydroxylase
MENLEVLRKVMKVARQRAVNLLRSYLPHPSSPETPLSDLRALPIIDQFHALWYSSKAWGEVTWQGHQILKNPLDLWLYQEIIFSHRPDVLIETGTHVGGSALYFSSIAQLFGVPMDVITIDIVAKITFDAEGHRIFPFVGVSTTSSTVTKVTARLRETAHKLERDPRIMVVLDSDHSKDNVLEELRLYAPLVTAGQYLVVEDTNINGHPVYPDHGPGPFEAVTEFLKDHPEFSPDKNCERYLMTFSPRGWLKRRN